LAVFYLLIVRLCYGNFPLGENSNSAISSDDQTIRHSGRLTCSAISCLYSLPTLFKLLAPLWAFSGSRSFRSRVVRIALPKVEFFLFLSLHDHSRINLNFRCGQTCRRSCNCNLVWLKRCVLSNLGLTLILPRTFVIAIHVFNLLYLRVQTSKKFFIVVICAAWSFVLLIILIGVLAIQNPENGPFYGIAGSWCWISSNYNQARIFLEYFFVSPSVAMFLQEEWSHKSSSSFSWQSHAFSSISLSCSVYGATSSKTTRKGGVCK